MSHNADQEDPLKEMQAGEKLSCFQRCCKCLCLAKMSQKPIVDRGRSYMTKSKPENLHPKSGKGCNFIGGMIDHEEAKRKHSAASPRSQKLRESLLTSNILIPYFTRSSTLTPEAQKARRTCRRFWEVIQPDESTKKRWFEKKKKESLVTNAGINEDRGQRGKYTMQVLIAINVLHGLAQLALGIYTWDDDCDYPFSELLLTCGVPNICMVSVYSLLIFTKEELFPVDEDDDEEMGFPLYVAGFVIWICFILDFSAWLILCLVYKKSDRCDSTLKHAGLSTVIIRGAILFTQLVLVVMHLKSKIRDENKRKLGVNPMRSIFKRKAKYLGDNDEDELIEAIKLYEATGDTTSVSNW